VTRNGPDGLCVDGCGEYNFGCLPPLPDGYSVWWHAEHEHYSAHGPGEWESVITWNPYQARRWAFAHAAEANL